MEGFPEGGKILGISKSTVFLRLILRVSSLLCQDYMAEEKLEKGKRTSNQPLATVHQVKIIILN